VAPWIIASLSWFNLCLNLRFLWKSMDEMDGMDPDENLMSLALVHNFGTWKSE